jgi:class 3 adenylate cyclase
VAARIAALAGADEIVASLDTVEAAEGSVPHGEVREEHLKGIRRSVRLVTLR